MMNKHPGSNEEKLFCDLLLEWWNKNKRDFPWRHTSDPYAVLIAELLLRKTTAKQVEKVYKAFLARYPNPESLSTATEAEVEGFLKPLGMEHRRARLLVELGRVLMEKHRGGVPNSIEDLLQLPGVGAYTANAVLCFAYGRNTVIVDTNAVRVFQRIFGFRSKRRRPRDDPALWEFARRIAPASKVREFNLAIIDFAHGVCTARKPRCNSCPVSSVCKYAKRETEKHEN